MLSIPGTDNDQMAANSKENSSEFLSIMDDEEDATILKTFKPLFPI